MTAPCRRAVILTALPVECKAITDHLGTVGIFRFEGDSYDQGIFVTPHASWHILVAEMGPGNSPAALHTDRIIRASQAEVALLVGIAGGIKDAKLGDVVAATKVYGYESGVDKEQFLPRPEVGRCSHNLVQEAKLVARRQRWQDRIPPTNSSTHTSLKCHFNSFIGPIAAGDKVFKNRFSALTSFLSTHYSDTLAVEMEGSGFLRAIYHSDTKPDSLIIRGISDLIADKEASDARGWQPLAATNAAAFAFELLSSLSEPSESSSGDREEESDWELTIQVSSAQLPGVLAHLRNILSDNPISLKSVSSTDEA